MRFLFLLLIVGAPAFADFFKQIKKVQFDIEMDLWVCPMKDAHSCTAYYGSKTLVKETLIAQPTSTDPTQGYTEPHYEKTYTLKREDQWAAEMPIVFSIDFNHWKFKGSRSEYLVTAHMNDPDAVIDGIPVEDVSALASVNHFRDIQTLLVQGRVKYITRPDGTRWGLLPGVKISNVRELK